MLDLQTYSKTSLLLRLNIVITKLHRYAILTRLIKNVEDALAIVLIQLTGVMRFLKNSLCVHLIKSNKTYATIAVIN